MAAAGATLDMSLFFGTPDQKTQFCHELLNLLKKRGCVKLQNHGIPSEDIHGLFEWVGYISPLCEKMDMRDTKKCPLHVVQTRKFFNLPLEDKMKIQHPPQANPNRGYSYVGLENVANISGYEKGLGPGKTKDIKVRNCVSFHITLSDVQAEILDLAGNCRLWISY